MSKTENQGLPWCSITRCRVLGDLVGYSLKTVRVAEKHLAIHINQKVMNGKLDLYPQMYPFQQQLRMDSSGRNEEGAVSNVQSLNHLRSLCFGFVPVATRRSSQRIPVIRRVAAAKHLLENRVGIGFAACRP